MGCVYVDNVGILWLNAKMDSAGLARGYHSYTVTTVLDQSVDPPKKGDSR